MLMVVPTVWAFFLLSSGEAKESFSYLEVSGMILVTLGTVYYIKADRDY